jgi:hypothetical protein
MKKKVTANENNDLKFRPNLYDPKKDEKKSEVIDESGNSEQAPTGLEYFTE